MTPHIYIDQPLDTNTKITLRDQAAKHLNAVLRLKPNDRVMLFDGQGNRISAHIETLSRHQAHLITQNDWQQLKPAFPRLRLYAALCQRSRFEWMLQKATELGVNHITPLISQRTKWSIPSSRQASRHAHWQHILINAAQQSQQAWLPQLDLPTQFDEALSHNTTSGVFASLTDHPKRLRDLAQPEHPFSIWVGPESGWDDQEITQFKQTDLHAISLGASVLRAETACIAAIAECRGLWSD